MGKVADARRKQLFKELEENGKLEVPLYRKRKMVKDKPKAKFVSVTGCYCRDRYRDNLPMSFRPCHGCPLDSTATEA